MIYRAQIPLAAGAATNKPDKIVIHAMAEYIDQGGRDFSAVEWLERLGLSAHALITPSGVIIECRDPTRGAYHAKRHNRNSLGVEFLVAGAHTYGTFLEAIKGRYLTEDQIAAGVHLVREWASDFRIPKDRIFRHSDLSPGRKFDPGDGFPWVSFLDEVTEGT